MPKIFWTFALIVKAENERLFSKGEGSSASAGQQWMRQLRSLPGGFRTYQAGPSRQGGGNLLRAYLRSLSRN